MKRVVRSRSFLKAYKKRIAPFGKLDAQFEARTAMFLSGVRGNPVNDHPLTSKMLGLKAYSIPAQDSPTVRSWEIYLPVMYGWFTAKRQRLMSFWMWGLIIRFTNRLQRPLRPFVPTHNPELRFSNNGSPFC